jgi:hypothetical protein
MRPAEGEVVRGFPVTRSFCSCHDEIKREEDDIERAVTAFKQCNRPNIGILGLYWCVRDKIYSHLGKEQAQRVPAAARADIISGGGIEWPEEKKRQQRAEMLGKSLTGPCIPMLWWGTLVHETQHYEQAAEMAHQLGADFYKEFEQLAGDPKRLDKLRKKFPKEVYLYETKMVYRDVHNRVEMELDSFEKQKRFFSEVRRVLVRICEQQPDKL